MAGFTVDIKEVYVAHEYEINEQNKCDYTTGRGAYGLVFCISGSATYKFKSGEVMNAKEGDLLLLGKNTAYRILLPKPFKHYTVNFDIHEEDSVLPMSKDGYYKITPNSFDEYNRAFKELTKSRELTADELRDMSMIGRLYGIFGMMAKDEEQRSFESYEYRRLLPAKSYIEQNFSGSITLDTLARLANMSVTNFRREWKRIMKSTPLEYRDVLRFKKAKELLSGGFKPVVEIAAECGFCNPSYFVRSFKKYTGLTPCEYRQSLAIL